MFCQRKFRINDRKESGSVTSKNGKYCEAPENESTAHMHAGRQILWLCPGHRRKINHGHPPLIFEMVQPWGLAEGLKEFLKCK